MSETMDTAGKKTENGSITNARLTSGFGRERLAAVTSSSLGIRAIAAFSRASVRTMRTANDELEPLDPRTAQDLYL